MKLGNPFINLSLGVTFVTLIIYFPNLFGNFDRDYVAKIIIGFVIVPFMVLYGYRSSFFIKNIALSLLIAIVLLLVLGAFYIFLFSPRE